MAAYSLARFKFRAQKAISFTIFLSRMVPPVVLLVPFFSLFRELNWTDKPISLAFSYTAFNLPFVIWLMWGFFKEIPYELEQAAQIDGASKFGAMVRIALPLARPGLAAASIFALINAWNEFLFALVLTGPDAKTLPVAAAQFVTNEAILWGPVNAAGTLIMLPLIIFTLLIQKHLVRGLTMGAIK
jgi:multiple sugar transport system permease protein